MSANCPRCRKPLEAQQLGELSFQCCRDCKGVWILHTDLMDVLEKSWRGIPQEQAEAAAFLVTDGWQNEPKFPCPDCGQSMEKYGYMNIAAIQIDRCDSCARVWLDAEELQNMVLALAKTNYRSQAAWETSRRQDWDMITPAAQTAGALGQWNARDWLLTGREDRLEPLVALLGLFLK